MLEERVPAYLFIVGDLGDSASAAMRLRYLVDLRWLTQGKRTIAAWSQVMEKNTRVQFRMQTGGSPDWHGCKARRTPIV